MADSAADLAHKFERAANTLPKAAREGVFSASLAAKDVFIAAAGTAGLTPGRKMRGVGKSGARWSVGFDVKGSVTPTSLIRFRGPVHLVEGDTKAHEIKARRVKALSLPHGAFAAVEHPGTKGKHFFDPAKQQVIHQTPPIVAAAQRRSLIASGFGK